jgi:hypothetical protein
MKAVIKNRKNFDIGLNLYYSNLFIKLFYTPNYNQYNNDIK